jgi:magnesium transporter
MSLPKINIIKQNGTLEWLDITNPDKDTLKKFQKKYKLRNIDIADCVNVTYRSKIDYYDDYIFAIFLYPVFIKDTREIESQEYDFWISKDFLITCHFNETNPVTDLFNKCLKNAKLKQEIINLPAERLLYEIHLRFMNYCIPIINHLDIEIDNIEKKIFSGHEKSMVKEISIVRRNITDYRKIVEPHKNILDKLKTSFTNNPNYKMNKKDIYFDNLIDYSQEIWNTLDNYKERIEALQESNESLISFKLNDIMSLLTIMSLITYPVTLVATVFGANTENPPITNFWSLVILMSIIALIVILVWYLRKKKWK